MAKTKTTSEYEVLERLVLAFQENAPIKNTTKKDQIRILAQGVRALEGEYDILRAKIKMEIDKVDKKTLGQVQRTLDLFPDANTDTTVDAVLSTLDSMSSRHLEAKLGKNAHDKRYEKLRIALAPIFLIQQDDDILLPTKWTRLRKRLPGVGRLVVGNSLSTIKFLLFLALQTIQHVGAAAPHVYHFIRTAYKFCDDISPDFSPWSMVKAAASGSMTGTTAAILGGSAKVLGSTNLCYRALEGLCAWFSAFDTRKLPLKTKIVIIPIQKLCSSAGFWDVLATFKKQIATRKDLAEDIILELKKDTQLTSGHKTRMMKELRDYAEFGFDEKNSGHRRLRGMHVKDLQKMIHKYLGPDHPELERLMKNIT